MRGKPREDTMGATTTWTGADPTDWADPTNWTNGDPLPGDTAIIPGDGVPAATYTGFNTSMVGLTVQLTANGELFANAITLVDTDVEGEPTTTSSLFVASKSLTVGHGSEIQAIGNEESSAFMNVETPKLTNDGLLASRNNGYLALQSNTGKTMSLVNNGQIDATNDGTVSITQANVTGNGSINISSGGDLNLSQVSFAANTDITFSANAAQGGGVLELYNEPDLVPAIHNFNVTDLVKIDNFAASGIADFFNVFTNTTQVVVSQHGHNAPSEVFSFAGNITPNQLGFANAGGAAYVFRTS
jgi:hypothetical protein